MNNIKELIKLWLLIFSSFKAFKYIHIYKHITSTCEIERMSAADYNFESLQTCSNNASPFRPFQCFEINVWRWNHYESRPIHTRSSACETLIISLRIMVSKFFPFLGASSHVFILYAYTRHCLHQIPLVRTSFTSYFSQTQTFARDELLTL